MNNQSFSNVFFAEIRRIVARKKAIIFMFIFAVASAVLALVSTLALKWTADEMLKNAGEGIGQVAVSVPDFIGFGMPFGFMTFFIGIMCVSSIARDYSDGTIRAFLNVVPNRIRLYTARLLMWVFIAFLSGLLALALITLMHLPYATSQPDFFINGMMSVLAYCLTVAMAYGIATIIRKGSLGVLVFICLQMLIPTILGGVSNFVPASFQTLFKFLSNAFPGSATEAFFSVTSKAGGDTPLFIFDIVMVFAWTALLIIVGFAVFKKKIH